MNKLKIKGELGAIPRLCRNRKDRLWRVKPDNQNFRARVNMNKENNKKSVGFSPENEVKFLGRLEPELRLENLKLELTTQVAEDFGLVEYSKNYVLEDGQILDPVSGESVVELTSRGGIDEETSAISKIEKGLSEKGNSTWVHFSPKNESLGYTENCVDFWRINEGKVTWNRLVINQGKEEMKKIYTMLEGEEIEGEEMELLSKPASAELKLAELFTLFRMVDSKTNFDYKKIENTVENIVIEFKKKFGESLVNSKDLILRTYSAVYDHLSSFGESKQEEILFSREKMSDYLYAPMLKMMTQKSYGCADSTMTGVFGEAIGYYVIDGKVSFGKVPEGLKYCKQCQCHYSGEKCPFC